MRTKDLLRRPTDVEGWKHFNSEFPDFALDLQNVCLELDANGFNPFGYMSVSYNMWHVVLIPYNLPP